MENLSKGQQLFVALTVILLFIILVESAGSLIPKLKRSDGMKTLRALYVLAAIIAVTYVLRG